MAAQQGRDYICKFNNGTSLVVIAGARGLTFTMNNETVNVTNKDGEAAAGHLPRALLEKAGESSMSISYTGVFQASADEEIFIGYARQNKHIPVTIFIPGVTVGSDIISGTFAIASYEVAGGYNDAMTYNITLESTGEYTVA